MLNIPSGDFRAVAIVAAIQSGDDVALLDALLDGGADIESPGAIFTNGSPMSDAVIFAQWRAARRLLERGARTTISQAAALGLLDRVEEVLRGTTAVVGRRHHKSPLARLPRRPAARRGISSRAPRQPELDRMGSNDATCRGAQRRSCEPCRMAANSGREIQRRAEVNNGRSPIGAHQ